jgi:hypothetical protein
MLASWHHILSFGTDLQRYQRMANIEGIVYDGENDNLGGASKYVSELTCLTLSNS